MLSRSITQIYDHHLRPLKVRFSQMNILMLITAAGPISAAEIGSALSLEKSTLSRNLKVMENQGWIKRQPGVSGLRNHYQSTASGKRLVCQAEPLWRLAQDEVEELLGSRVSEAIHQAFNRIQQSVSSD
jgi:DNA-binding MarR family transcriptional regulator